MATRITPRMTFRGGPLDGQTRDKNSPGRWSQFLNPDGEWEHREYLLTDRRWYELDGTTTYDAGREIRYYKWVEL